MSCLRWFLVGHSLGGAMAVEFALVYPERVRGLFQTCGALLGHPPCEVQKQTHTRMVELFQSGDMEAVSAYDLRNLLDGPIAEEGRVQGPVRDLVAAIRKEKENHG